MITRFKLKLKHDNGLFSLVTSVITGNRTMEQMKQIAIDQVCYAENCPPRAIQSVEVI